ncbi:MAG TPA: hypothetical protein PKA06_12900 [Gemmatales bacterium]|nr:hypothetical protein [Gemmatales bacterium]
MRHTFALLACLLVASASQAQVVFLIDNFDNTPGSVGDPTLDGNGAWAGFGPGIVDVVGGHRVLGNYLTEVSGPGPYGSATNIASGVFSIDNNFNTRSGGQVIWQGSSTTPGTNSIISHPADFNLGSLDLESVVSSPDFYFQWFVINADSRDWTYTFRAYTNNASNYFEGSVTSNLSGVALSIFKGNFTAVGSPSWNDIDAISFSASYTGGLLGGDLAVDFFQLAVPEMSTYLMLTLMLCLIGAYRVWFKKPEASTENKTEATSESEIQEPVLVTAAQ